MKSIKEIRGQLDEISPWPWIREDCVGAGVYDKEHGYMLDGDFVGDENAEFIASAPQTISDLCELVEKLREFVIDKCVPRISYYEGCPGSPEEWYEIWSDEAKALGCFQEDE